MSSILNKRTWHNLEPWITVLLILFSMGFYIENIQLLQLIRLASYGVLTLLLIGQWKQCIYLATKNFSLLLLIGIAVFSVLWSTDMQATLEASRGVIRTTLIGVYFATRYQPKEQLQLLAWVLGIEVIFSLVISLFLPELGLSEKGGAWRGIFAHKNELGRAMTLSTIIFLLTAFKTRRYLYRWAAWLMIILSVALVWLAQAKLALVALVLSVSIFFLIRITRTHYYKLQAIFMTTIFLVIGSALTWLVNNGEIMLELLGKDATLNGRIGIWAALLEISQERPWLGIGYFSKSIWQEYGSLIRASAGWDAGHSHNGFLQVLIELGLVGLVVFLFNFCTAYAKAMVRAIQAKNVEDVWPVLFLILMFMINMTMSSTILAPLNLFWMLYVATVLSLSYERIWVNGTNNEDSLEKLKLKQRGL